MFPPYGLLSLNLDLKGALNRPKSGQNGIELSNNLKLLIVSALKPTCKYTNFIHCFDLCDKIKGIIFQGYKSTYSVIHMIVSHNYISNIGIARKTLGYYEMLFPKQLFSFHLIIYVTNSRYQLHVHIWNKLYINFSGYFTN